MPTSIQGNMPETTLLNRVFAILKAVEKGSQFSVVERHAIRLSQQATDLEDKIHEIELGLH